MAQLPPDRIPVIAGIGEIADRPKDVTRSLEPLALMAEAARRADTEASGLLNETDSLDIIALVSWRYEEIAAQLTQRLGISPTRSHYGNVGGESPVRFLHEAAQRIALGTSQVGLIIGAEAQYAVGHAKRGNVELPWTPYAINAPKMKRAADYVHPLGHKLGVAWPISVYPFYDAATAHAWGQTPAEAQAESALLWSRYSAAAARNPYSWSKTALSPEDIAAVTQDNRIIGWPYTKRMVANPNVNQGAAILVTSLAKARAAGIPEHQLIFIGAGASATEPRDWLARDAYTVSHAQDAVLDAMLGQVDGDASRFDALELYSCFPTVPKMARRNLHLSADLQPSVCGGLSFFGGPLNVYMAHAACAMVRALRDGKALGLLYGQGEFVTKHHALILAREPQGDSVLHDLAAQLAADGARAPRAAHRRDPQRRRRHRNLHHPARRHGPAHPGRRHRLHGQRRAHPRPHPRHPRRRHRPPHRAGPLPHRRARRRAACRRRRPGMALGLTSTPNASVTAALSPATRAVLCLRQPGTSRERQMRIATLIAATAAMALLSACNESNPAPSIASENESKMSDRIVSLEQTITDMQADAVKMHADPGPAVYFVNLKDGDTVASPVRVVFGVYGMGVAPAGVDKEKTGHHHLLIDTELTPEEMQFAIPNDEKHMHFGAGQTEVVLQLPAGPHTLQLVFGDMKHEMIKPTPMLSSKIAITVK